MAARRGGGFNWVIEAIFAAVMHDQRANQHREQEGGDQRLLLPGQGDGPGKAGQPVPQGIDFLPLAHCLDAF